MCMDTESPLNQSSAPTISPAPTVYARREHGGHPVRIRGEGRRRTFEVAFPEKERQFSSARQLLLALYNEGETKGPEVRDPGMSFDRYFRLGTWASHEVTIPKRWGSVLDMFGNPAELEPAPPAKLSLRRESHINPRGGRWNRPVERAKITVLDMFEAPAIIQATAKKLTVPKRMRKATAKQKALTIAPPIMGIDLQGRGHEVRKILYGCFGRKMSSGGYDPEEVLQEVYKGLLTRNMGKCPFDSKKSSFGHYVYMVCNCVLSNYHRKMQRRGEFEQLGLPALTTGERGSWEVQDAALSARSVGDHQTDQSDNVQAEMAIKSLSAYFVSTEEGAGFKELAPSVIALLYQGNNRQEISRLLGIPSTKVSSMVKAIRGMAHEWRADEVAY